MSAILLWRYFGAKPDLAVGECRDKVELSRLKHPKKSIKYQEIPIHTRDGVSSKAKIKRRIVWFLLKTPPWQRFGNTFHYSKKRAT